MHTGSFVNLRRIICLKSPTFLLQKHFDLLCDDDDMINGSVNVENIEPPVSDIEDLVSDEEDEPLDKARYNALSFCSNAYKVWNSIG